jgi:uncharacterized integral membrane protein (TIGR00698 family)
MTPKLGTAMFHHKPGDLFPGVLLCAAVSVAATILERLEVPAFGHAWLDALVLAILLGALLRTVWSPDKRWHDGIKFSGKTLLEVAVLLLGASVRWQTIMAVRPGLLVGVVAVVLMAIATSYGIGRLLGLPRRIATLVACGNSICGNSAIAAVAPVIGADGEDISASITFTAVLGVIVVLGLPFAAGLLHFSGLQYGVLAGLTVYAVPQVLAATAPVGPVAVQIGTLIKLLRVLMLGPVIVGLSLLTRYWRFEPDDISPRVETGDRSSAARLPLHRLVPWYIVGFLMFAALRSSDLVPHPAVSLLVAVTNPLTVIAMAALGLGTELRTVARAGSRVTAAVALSLLVLAAISCGLIHLLGIA